MTALQKPHANRGTYCPLWRKDVSKVCHACEFWEPLPVGRKLPTGEVETFDHWACTLKHATFVLRDLGKAIEGMQAATESFRNTAWADSQQTLSDVIETVKHQNSVNGEVARRMGDGFSAIAGVLGASRLPPGDEQKLIG